ncbi:MAG: hypothetical protein K0Q87_2150 [Neobacillus sp.]|jgi:hypothetical protein|nr:hypothetical protein [Neobacillus sp.]
MEKVKLALNYALMLEMIKAKGLDQQAIITLLNEGEEADFENFGEGIPTWKTLIDYYRINKNKFHLALKEGYEITFLTKGALKSLLRIKFGMKEGEDFIDTGEFLDQVKITNEDLDALQGVISKNWTIVKEEGIKIELTYKPVFNI